MLDTFINLAATAGTLGKVTAASLYENGLIVIEVEEDEKCYTLTYNERAKVAQDEDS